LCVGPLEGLGRKVWTKREQGKVGFRRGAGGVRLKKPFPPPLPTRVSYLRMVLAPGGVSNSKLMYYLARKSEWWSANSI